MAHRFYNRVDGQYGRPVLDQKSTKTLESFRIKPSQEDGGTDRETQVLEDSASNGLGTEVSERFLGETTESNEADGAVDTGGDGKRRDTLDQEGPKQYLSKFTNTRLGAGQGRRQHPEV